MRGSNVNKPVVLRLCPPASLPWAIIMSTPEAIAARAVPIELVCSHTSQCASFSRRIHSVGGGAQKNTTAGTRCSMQTSMCASVVNGPKSTVSMRKLTPNGRFVRSRVAPISSRKTAGGAAPHANWPNPPAFETAATSGGRAMKPIPAETKGSSMP